MGPLAEWASLFFQLTPQARAELRGLMLARRWKRKRAFVWVALRRKPFILGESVITSKR